MKKVIDLCLDMPLGAKELSNMLSSMYLDPLYRGYKNSYGPGIAAQAGLTSEELEEVCAREGTEGFLRTVREAADKNVVRPEQFVAHLDEVGSEWGITCDGDHDNKKTAEIVRAFPQKFKGFIIFYPSDNETVIEVDIDNEKIKSDVLSGIKTTYSLVLTPKMLIYMGRFLGKVALEYWHKTFGSSVFDSKFDEIRKYVRYGTTKHTPLTSDWR